MHTLLHDPDILAWLRLAGIIIIALAALLALVAIALLSQNPDAPPLLIALG